MKRLYWEYKFNILQFNSFGLLIVKKNALFFLILSMLWSYKSKRVMYVIYHGIGMPCGGVGGISVASSEQMPNNVHVIVINYPPLSLAGKIK